MSAAERLAKLGVRIGKPVALRYDPWDAMRGHDEIRVDIGSGPWVVAIEHYVPASQSPAGRRAREIDGLAAGESVREAVRQAELAVDRRLVEAEHQQRTDEAARHAKGDQP